MATSRGKGSHHWEDLQIHPNEMSWKLTMLLSLDLR